MILLDFLTKKISSCKDINKQKKQELHNRLTHNDDLMKRARQKIKSHHTKHKLIATKA